MLTRQWEVTEVRRKVHSAVRAKAEASPKPAEDIPPRCGQPETKNQQRTTDTGTHRTKALVSRNICRLTKSSFNHAMNAFVSLQIMIGE